MWKCRSRSPLLNQSFLPLVQGVERRLSGIANFLNTAGKLEMVKTVLASMSTFMMCTLELPIPIKRQLEKYMRHCLWRKPDLTDKRPAMVKWTTVCRPKKQGGLGVMNIDIQNKSLMLKILHKFYNKMDIPWVSLIWSTYYNESVVPGEQSVGSFWWKSHIKLIICYKGLARCNFGIGVSAYFWHDLWHDTCLSQAFPRLHSFTKDT